MYIYSYLKVEECKHIISCKKWIIFCKECAWCFLQKD